MAACVNKCNMDRLVLIFAAVAVGTLIPLQSAFNGRLGALSSPLWAAFVSFLGGTVFIAFLNLIAGGMRENISNIRGLPIYYFSGGILGVMFVTTASFVVPRLGVATMLMSGLLGQLIMSTWLDHIGAFSGREIPISFSRALGIALVGVGVILIERGKGA